MIHHCATVARRPETNWLPAVETRMFTTQSLAGRRVLVVEDEMLVLMDAEDMLLALGCKSIVAAATIEQAIVCIEETTFDAALLDLNLNGDRSYAVADALAARNIPFAFATGYGAHGLRDSDAGRPVLTKPYGFEELGRVMVGLLTR